MTAERNDGMTEGGTAQPPASAEAPAEKPDGKLRVERFTLAITVAAAALDAFIKAQGKHKEAGPDVLTVATADRLKVRMKDAAGKDIEGETTDFRLNFPTTFAPGEEVGRFRCVIAGELTEIALADIKPEDWRDMADTLTRRNAALGLTVPTGTPKAVTGRPADFAVAAGFVPMHKLAERGRGGLPLFPDASRKFHELRTPLNWATGLALFRFTSPDRPEDWQEVTLADLTDRVLCLTERDAPRRGDHALDILAEVVKLFAETIAIVTPRFEKHGRLYQSRVDLVFDRIIATLGLSYVDTKTGRLVRPDNPALPQTAIVPLTVKGRRAYTPDGKDIKALLGDRYKLESIRWRWSPRIVDDLKAAPRLDKKGNPMRDKSGKVLRGGFNVLVAVRIFDALFRLRVERAFVAHDLLVLLATDIYKPPKQVAAAARNVIEREADRLFDLLGLKDDPKHPDRREETVAAAVARLMQPDIGALLPTSDTTPRQPSEAEKRGGRRLSPYYRLVRSALYTPPGILSKAEGEVLEAEQRDAYQKHVPEAAQPPALPGPKADQAVLPGMEAPPAMPIPSGPDIRAAREAAGVNLRDFARMVAGPAFKTWANYETGKPIRVGSIKPDTWQRVRDFIAQHAPKADPDGGKGAA